MDKFNGGIEAASVTDARIPHIYEPARWENLKAWMKSVVPEAFTSDGQVLNLIEGEWKEPGHPRPFHSANDGTLLGMLPMVDAETARRAVEFAAREFATYSRVDLDERKRRVSECVRSLREHRVVELSDVGHHARRLGAAALRQHGDRQDADRRRSVHADLGDGACAAP